MKNKTIIISILFCISLYAQAVEIKYTSFTGVEDGELKTSPSLAIDIDYGPAQYMITAIASNKEATRIVIIIYSSVSRWKERNDTYEDKEKALREIIKIKQSLYSEFPDSYTNIEKEFKKMIDYIKNINRDKHY